MKLFVDSKSSSIPNQVKTPLLLALATLALSTVYHPFASRAQNGGSERGGGDANELRLRKNLRELQHFFESNATPLPPMVQNTLATIPQLLQQVHVVTFAPDRSSTPTDLQTIRSDSQKKLITVPALFSFHTVFKNSIDELVFTLQIFHEAYSGTPWTLNTKQSVQKTLRQSLLDSRELEIAKADLQSFQIAYRAAYAELDRRWRLAIQEYTSALTPCLAAPVKDSKNPALVLRPCVTSLKLYQQYQHAFSGAPAMIPILTQLLANSSAKANLLIPTLASMPDSPLSLDPDTFSSIHHLQAAAIQTKSHPLVRHSLELQLAKLSQPYAHLPPSITKPVFVDNKGCSGSSVTVETVFCRLSQMQQSLQDGLDQVRAYSHHLDQVWFEIQRRGF